MNKKTIWIMITIVIIGILGIALGISRPKLISHQHLAVINKIMAAQIKAEQIETVEIPPAIAANFPAVNQLYKLTDDRDTYYAMVLSPHGYRAPIKMMVVIDHAHKQVMGIKVMQQDETPGYGEWLAEDWFTQRFKGKSVDQYLKRAVLEAHDANDIIQITSATVTTQAVLNGVNSAMGIYRELILGQQAEAVPLKVEGFITENP